MYNSNEYTPGEKYLKEYIVNNNNGEHCVRIPDAFEALKIERKCLIEKAVGWLEANADKYAGCYFDGVGYMEDEFYRDFKRAMEE